MSARYGSDAHYDLTWISDAVHGPIDTRDSHGLGGDRRLIALMNSQLLDRLRRVKQVFFAPQSYLSADHSRYAHSIGTMHVMRLLLTRLTGQGTIPDQLFHELHRIFPETFDSPNDSTLGILSQHLLTAALLQDIGELPFSQATRHVFAPDSELRLRVADELNRPSGEPSSKQVFAIGCLIESKYRPLFDGYSIPFMIYLLTGEGIASLAPESPLRLLRHMLDGVVDADRLDYVYRDAHHTIGTIGTPASVVETLESYDSSGPIFDDPGQVSLFLAMRAHLYSTVYHAAAIRFRTILLVHTLQGIARNERCAAAFFGDRGSADLSIDEFLELDDVSLTSRITEFSSQTSLVRLLDSKARLALELFVAGATPYESIWLPPGTNEGEADPNLALPSDLFYDTFADQTRDLYQAASVRIRSERFRLFATPAPLEECGGSFASLYREPWTMLPMPQSTLLYLPKQRNGRPWMRFNQALEAGWLPYALLAQDPLNGLDVPPDTRRTKGFSGPALFISFTWADVGILKRVVSLLYRRRVKYYVLLAPFQGVGGTPGQNSIDAARQADRALILVSRDYIKRYHDVPDGNVSKEVFELSRRAQALEISVAFLSVDPIREVKEGLPWSQFGHNEPPFVGQPLRHANDHVLSQAVDALMEYFE